VVDRLDCWGALGSPFLYEEVTVGYTNGGWPPLRQPPAGEAYCWALSDCGGDYLDRSSDLAAADASGANPNPAGRLINHDLNGLEVGEPATLATIVGMADMVAGGRPLAADSTDARHIQLQYQASSLVTAHNDSCLQRLRQGSSTCWSRTSTGPHSPPNHRSLSRCPLL
jgi:hypothetical protein